jgi:hypothetical protein
MMISRPTIETPAFIQASAPRIIDVSYSVHIRHTIPQCQEAKIHRLNEDSVHDGTRARRNRKACKNWEVQLI